MKWGCVPTAPGLGLLILLALANLQEDNAADHNDDEADSKNCFEFHGLCLLSESLALLGNNDHRRRQSAE